MGIGIRLPAGRLKIHRATLCSQHINEHGIETADRLKQPLEHLPRRFRVRQGAVGDRWVDIEAVGQALKRVSTTTEPAAGDAHGI